jgi:hypothetical protein
VRWGRSGKIHEGFGGKSGKIRKFLKEKVRISGEKVDFGHFRPVSDGSPKGKMA